MPKLDPRLKFLLIRYLFYFTDQMTASFSWTSFVTKDRKVLRNIGTSSCLLIYSIIKELLVQESESVIHLIEIGMMPGHSKMTFLLCRSDPYDDRRREAGFNQTAFSHLGERLKRTVCRTVHNLACAIRKHDEVLFSIRSMLSPSKIEIQYVSSLI